MAASSLLPASETDWSRTASLSVFISSLRVGGVDPPHRLGLLDRLDVEVDRDRLAVAAAEHALERLVAAGVDLLVRHPRRDVDEVARPGLGGELERLAPAHPRPPLDDVDDAFERAVMMRPGLRAGMDVHRASPELLRADAREVDRRLAVHS